MAETRTPVETLAYISDIGVAKAERKLPSLLILAFFAGVFIAFAAGASTMAVHNLLSNPDANGLARVISGCVFGTGLMMVVLAGGELFTGNNLMIVAVLDRRITFHRMLVNWFFVYGGNLLGSLLIAWMMAQTGLFNSSKGLLGGIVVKIATDKTSLSFFSAFLLGVMCNWLVCIAVWVSSMSNDIISKTMTIFFIIGLFVLSGFEHCIANMYYIPVGILAKQNPQWIAMSGLTAEQLASLNWGTFFTKNLIPVTLGNIVGGTVMVGTLFWVALRKKKVG
jgi:formate/nitrite transporter